MKKLILSSVLISSFLFSNAQPSEAEIKKQLVSSGTKSIKFIKATGTRQWNSDLGNWEYVSGVEVIRNSDYPGIDLVIAGDVVYQYTGVGKYSYLKFRTISNQYLGIPNPDEKEIIDFISSKWQTFYGYYFSVITKLWQQPVLAEKPDWIWHSPNSVEFKMKVKYDIIISNTEIETQEAIWNVRFYRDNPKDSWKNFIATKDQNEFNEKKLGVQKFTAEQINDLRKQTLQYTVAEAIAQKNAASLPSISVPVFIDANKMVAYVHNILRNGSPEELRAVFLQLFGKHFFEEGSSVQLREVEEQNLNQVVTAVYKNKATYKLMYCQHPPYRIENYPDGRKSIYIPASVNNCTSNFIIGLVNYGYREGVAQTQLKILEYGIYVRQDQDAINYVNSFSDRNNLCKQD
ncbi:MAG: hypothetical protein ACKVOW_13095 [Chitinophagaceae bacterium]